MKPFDVQKYGTSAQDVTYCEIDGQELKMDVHYPSSGGPWPCMIFVHGGGWSEGEGDKAPLAVIPTDAGILVVSINYRTYPAYHFPAMIEDVKCAIRMLRANAAEYNLDPERIALVGHSAGAHLAALAGLADDCAGWDTGSYLEQSSRVQAVVMLSGPSDLTCSFSAWVTDLIGNVFGADRRAGSPVTYVRQDAPPFLIIHGEADDVIPAEQAHLLHNALINVGVQSQLVIVQNAGHGYEPVNGPVTPTMEQTFGIILSFLTHTLRI